MTFARSRDDRAGVDTRRFAAVMVVALNTIIGGYLLLTVNGVFMAILERGTVWEGLTPLPSYPVARLVLYLTIAVILQFVSAWLLMPRGTHTDTAGLWSQYTTRVVICMGGSLVAAFAIMGYVIALLDGGAV